MSDTHFCRDCGEQRPVEEFYRYPSGYYPSYCRMHNRIRKNAQQKNNPEPHRKAAREHWRRKHGKLDREYDRG